jgi:hypothetical protein
MIDEMHGTCQTSTGYSTERQLLAACELADQILARDGIQELRGLAWHDGERWKIQEAIRRANGETK